MRAIKSSNRLHLPLESLLKMHDSGSTYCTFYQLTNKNGHNWRYQKKKSHSCKWFLLVMYDIVIDKALWPVPCTVNLCLWAAGGENTLVRGKKEGLQIYSAAPFHCRCCFFVNHWQSWLLEIGYRFFKAEMKKTRTSCEYFDANFLVRKYDRFFTLHMCCFPSKHLFSSRSSQDFQKGGNLP